MTTNKAIEQAIIELRNNPELKDNYTVKQLEKILSSLSEEEQQQMSELLQNDDIEETDNRAEVEQVRDTDGHITEYKFIIYKQNQEPITGSFSRDEMWFICRSYSNLGSGLTAREVARSFERFSLTQFRSILRTFNITKASAPFAPHMIEEESQETLLAMLYRAKENDVVRKYEADRVRHLEIENNKLRRNVIETREIIDSAVDAIKDIDVIGADAYTFEPASEAHDSSLIVWLSDMHIGAMVPEDALYKNDYNASVVRNRLNKVCNQIKNSIALYGGFHQVVICSLGDAVDGYNNCTARGTELCQNMNNKDQTDWFIRLMTEFMYNVSDVVSGKCDSLRYITVGESNHGGDFEYALQSALAAHLKAIKVDTQVSRKSIDYFKVPGCTFLYAHGNDSKNMGKGMPLAVNDRLENYVNDYIDCNQLSGNIVFVKGDLHRSATSQAKRFTYKSVGSLFGSSDWIMSNFGMTKATCDYSIVDNEGNRLDGLIKLQ